MSAMAGVSALRCSSPYARAPRGPPSTCWRPQARTWAGRTRMASPPYIWLHWTITRSWSGRWAARTARRSMRKTETARLRCTVQQSTVRPPPRGRCWSSGRTPRCARTAGPRWCSPRGGASTRPRGRCTTLLTCCRAAMPGAAASPTPRCHPAPASASTRAATAPTRGSRRRPSVPTPTSSASTAQRPSSRSGLRPRDGRCWPREDHVVGASGGHGRSRSDAAAVPNRHRARADDTRAAARDRVRAGRRGSGARGVRRPRQPGRRGAGRPAASLRAGDG